MNPPLPKPAKLDALTGMRFFAAYAVLLHHLAAHLALPVLTIPLFGLFGLNQWQVDLGRLDLAKSAVSFFFVLSGFVLAYNYDGKLTRQNYPRFWFQRFARIYPAHLVTLLAAIFLMAGRPEFSQYEPWEWLRLGLHTLLLQSWALIQKYVFAYNGVAWSISVEFFFYAMFPFLIASGKRLGWICLGLLAGSLLTYAVVDWYFIHYAPVTELSQRQLSHTFPPARLLEFASGILACRVFKKNQGKLPSSSSWATLLEVSLIALFIANHYLIGEIPRYLVRTFGEPRATAGFFRYSGEVGTFFLTTIVLAHGHGLLCKVLSTKPLVYLGEISFSLYLCHQIILRVFEQLGFYQSQYGYWMDLAVLNVVVIAVSSLIYHLVEMPCKNRLVNLYDGKESFGLGWLSRFVLPLFSIPIWLNLAILWAAISFTFATKGPPRVVEQAIDAKALTRITRNSPRELQNAIFTGRARLLGFRAQPGNQSLKVDFVFRPMEVPAEELEWTVEAVNDSGQPLGTFELTQTLSADNGSAVRYLSKYSLDLSELEGNFHVAVTLRMGVDPETGKPQIIPVEVGPSLRNGELLVLGTYDREYVASLWTPGVFRDKEKPALLPFGTAPPAETAPAQKQ